MKKIYLISTEHLEDGLWFRDEEDFKVAMNYIAIEAARHPVVIVFAFILMSNHLHFVLKGRRASVEAFVTQLKHRYSIYYRHKYGAKEFLRRNGIDIQEILWDDEAPERAIAYVLMNCVAANICAHPSQYHWGTGALLFNSVQAGGKRLSHFSARALKRLLHSDEDNLPGDWILSDDGYILPENYVDIKTVESLFRTPNRLNYFLRTSSKAKKRLESKNNLPSFRDQSILASIPDMCRSLFQKDSFQQLESEDRKELARQIRFRFSADATQIARVCGISYEDAAHLLDSA